MYIEKQKQPSRKNRRLYPRMKCRVTIELRPQEGEVPVLGNLIDVSLGGCYVETSVIMAPDSRLLLNFAIDDGPLTAEGSVVRSIRVWASPSSSKKATARIAPTCRRFSTTSTTKRAPMTRSI